MALRLRRGTDAERLLITPLAGELIYTTDTKLLYVGDGTTIGGTLVTGSGGGGGATTLDALTDTDLTGAANGDVLAYNAGTNKWQPAEIPGLGAFSLDDLDDVFINPNLLVRGQILRYDGINWTPQESVEEFGSYKINILGDDSSVIVNTLNNTVTGNFVGELVGTVVGVLDGEMKGSVFSDDSSLIIDGINRTIHTEDIQSSNGLYITSQTELVTRMSGLSDGSQIPKLQIHGVDGSTENPLTVPANRFVSALEFTTQDVSGIVGGDGKSLASFIAQTDSTANMSEAAPASNLYLTLAASDGQGDDPTTNYRVFSFLTNGTFDSKIISHRAQTSAAVAAITPTAGMVVFDSDTQKFRGYVDDTGLAGGGASNSTPGWIDLH